MTSIARIADFYSPTTGILVHISLCPVDRDLRAGSVDLYSFLFPQLTINVGLKPTYFFFSVKPNETDSNKMNLLPVVGVHTKHLFRGKEREKKRSSEG